MSARSLAAASAVASLVVGISTGRNGPLIAFTRAFPTPRQLEIGLIGTDGQGLRRLQTGIAPSFEPEWSPDGRWILFRGGRADDLYLIRPDGSRRQQLTHDGAHEQSAAWSPDGTKIAYTRYATPSTSTSIWVLTLEHGRAAKRLTRDALGAGTPSWSPDGAQIAFVSETPQHGYDPELWLMNADGSHQRRIFPALAGAGDPVWAPYGHRLLISDGDRLYVLDARPGHPRAIVALSASASGERTDPFPEWSPDGTKVVFDQLDRRGRSEIWLVNADGSGLRRAVGPSGGALGDSDPSWQPAPH